MHRPVRRRLIVLVTLLSHLMAALLVHVPMAYAATPAPAETATSPPCPDHMQMDHGSATSADEAPGATDHAPGCKSGPCKCPCAHAQALAFAPSLGAPLLVHSPAQDRYSVRLAPDCQTAFFRPPIV